MTKDEAKAVLANIIPAARWGAFTDWMESLEEDGGCSHDDETYAEWLTTEGIEGADQKGRQIYDAMSAYSSFGPCACAAGQDFLSPPHSAGP